MNYILFVYLYLAKLFILFLIILLCISAIKSIYTHLYNKILAQEKKELNVKNNLSPEVIEYLTKMILK